MLQLDSLLSLIFVNKVLHDKARINLCSPGRIPLVIDEDGLGAEGLDSASTVAAGLWLWLSVEEASNWFNNYKILVLRDFSSFISPTIYCFSSISLKNFKANFDLTLGLRSADAIEEHDIGQQRSVNKFCKSQLRTS